MNNITLSITLPKTALDPDNPDGALHMAKLLKKNPHINSLVLRNREIGNKELRAIGEILKDNTTISNLDLQNNNVTDQGIEILASCLMNNTTLTSLNLLNNNLTNKCIKTLSYFIKNKVWDIVYLGENHITKDGIKDFKYNNDLILSW